MVQSGTARCAFQSPCPTHRTASRMWVARGGHHSPMPTGTAQFRTADTDRRGCRPSSGRIDFAPPMCALPHSTPDARGLMSRFSGASPNDQRRSLKGELMGKLEGKVAVITGGSSGMALASAQRFVEEGAYVF